MGLWELVSLEFDTPGKKIGEYFEELGIEIRRVREIRPHSKKTKICKIVNKALGNSSERKLVVYGSGYYHHFTYGLCRYADRISQDYGYVHFDHHSDSYKKDGSFIDCAAFVTDILEDTNASTKLHIGLDAPEEILVSDKSQLSITEEQLREAEGFENLREKLTGLPEEVYLTFDLDVMDPSLIYTDYNQGSLKEEELMRCITLIKNTKYIIGADILGYTGVYEKFPGKKLYARIVESLLEA